MATSWVKSLQCKSRAADDVVHHHLLPVSTSCRFQTLRDVVHKTDSNKKNPKQRPKKQKSPPPPSPPERPNNTEIRPQTFTLRPRAVETCFPALTELPEGHASRNVVEIIFHTSWSVKPFPGRVDMVFKVQNMARTVARFEEYREAVKSSAGFENDDGKAGVCEDHTRCLADGNEVMRFYCLGPAALGVGSEYNTWGQGRNQHPAQTFPGSTAWGFSGNKGAAICTFSGSSVAHDNAGGGRGRRAMLVCRVIAGRVRFDSMSREKGELLVYDTRALLPCFLIIYKV